MQRDCGTGAQATLDERAGAGSGAKNFCIVEPKPQPEICAPVPQPWFVGQASYSKNTMFSVLNAPNHLGTAAGAKNFSMLETEPELEPEIIDKCLATRLRVQIPNSIFQDYKLLLREMQLKTEKINHVLDKLSLVE